MFLIVFSDTAADRVSAHLICQQCGHGSASLVIVHVCTAGSHQDKDEADRHGGLQGRAEHSRFLQTHKHDRRPFQEIQSS